MALKKLKGESSSRLKIHDSITPNVDKEPPSFSLRYLRKDFCLNNCNRDEKAQFADALYKRSQLTWEQLRQTGRQELGYEKIAHESIKASIPSHITPDMNIIAFRCIGNAPMVGYRDINGTFHIVWIDRTFTLYDHS